MWLSNTSVEKLGFEKIAERKWVRGEDIVTYDGTWWRLNDGIIIETVNDLKIWINGTKPE